MKTRRNNRIRLNRGGNIDKWIRAGWKAHKNRKRAAIAEDTRDE
jgi:hypothetical protein